MRTLTYSVTQRIKTIKQPVGGYLPNKYFDRRAIEDDYKLNEEENVSPSLVGMAVDYLTRFMMGSSVEEAFEISIEGSKCIDQERKARRLLSKIKGLDNTSIDAAIKLTGYDVCYRNSSIHYKPVESIKPNKETISNIRIMVIRSLKFFETYGPIVKSHMTFEGGYTDIVGTGDGDFLTKDTLWDFKVSVNHPKVQHTLQVLMYYIMGLNSIYPEYKEIRKIGFFNPRLNMVYVCDISKIPQKTYSEVSKRVIGYPDDKTKRFISLFADIDVEILDQKDKLLSKLSANDIEIIREATKLQNAWFRCRSCGFEWSAPYRKIKKSLFLCPACEKAKNKTIHEENIHVK